jgi:thiamine biosynthesis protein ThiS
MDITINGQARTITDAQNIADLVGKFCPTPKAIIAEVNGSIVPSQSWSSTKLQAGDTVELVSFVGGG